MTDKKKKPAKKKGENYLIKIIMRFNQFIDKFKLIEILLILIPLSAISGPLIPDLVMVSWSLSTALCRF